MRKIQGYTPKELIEDTQGKNQKLILDLLIKKNDLYARQIADELKIDPIQNQLCLKAMLKKHIIKRKKNGYYQYSINWD